LDPILLQRQPLGVLAEQPATANLGLLAQFANQRASNPRPNVTDVFGYGPTWGSYAQNFNKNLAEQYPTDSPEAINRTVMRMALNVGPLATVFHGSPHLFDKFDLSKVAPGDSGGTSFGLGINLSKDPKHAMAYKGEGGHLYKVDLPDDSIKSFIKWEQPVSKDLAESIPAIDMTKPIPFGGGAFIENINGEWMLRAGETKFRLRESEVMRMFGDQNTGEQVYRKLVATFGGDERAASNWLKERGVKGIANSTERNAENFVVFDDQIPKIIGRE
jgi:hypothetical protein